MTPFDPDALVAMLRAFYPIVGRAALARARVERPEYFAGGVLIGSSRTHLQLGDGRIFDLVFNEGGPASQTHWQALDVTDDAGGPPDPFPLEPGPLDPIDEAIEIFPGGDPSFEAIVTGELGALDGADGLLSQAAQDVIAFDGAGELEDSYAALVEPAVEAHAEIRSALDADDPSDLVAATIGHDGEITAGQNDYVEEPVEPDVPDPPFTPPHDEDPPKPPKRDPGDGL